MADDMTFPVIAYLDERLLANLKSNVTTDDRSLSWLIHQAAQLVTLVVRTGEECARLCERAVTNFLAPCQTQEKGGMQSATATQSADGSDLIFQVERLRPASARRCAARPINLGRQVALGFSQLVP